MCIAWRSQVFVELSGALNLARFLKYLVLLFRPLLGDDHKRCAATILYRESPNTITVRLAFPSWRRQDKARHDFRVLSYAYLCEKLTAPTRPDFPGELIHRTFSDLHSLTPFKLKRGCHNCRRMRKKSAASAFASSFTDSDLKADGDLSP